MNTPDYEGLQFQPSLQNGKVLVFWFRFSIVVVHINLGSATLVRVYSIKEVLHSAQYRKKKKKNSRNTTANNCSCQGSTPPVLQNKMLLNFVPQIKTLKCTKSSKFKWRKLILLRISTMSLLAFIKEVDFMEIGRFWKKLCNTVHLY